MFELDHPEELARVSEQLAKAWAFLSGEQRRFELLVGKNELLQFTEFSFFMPLAVHEEGRDGGVGVLIQREDAIHVATHMFGVPHDEVREAEMRDACSEVCNVLADCMARHFSLDQAVSVALPARASTVEFEQIAENSTARAVYRGCAGTRCLLIVVYDSLISCSEVNP